jgi:hypothetical protein
LTKEEIMSAVEKLEQRLTAVEAELAEIKQRLPAEKPAGHAWLERIYGAFANDPEYEEAMRLGREYRESLRPKTRKRRKRKDAHVGS